MPSQSADNMIVIKRYACSRLYDAAGACYVSIDMLRTWRAQAVAFTVLDAETGEDVTGVLLARSHAE